MTRTLPQTTTNVHASTDRLPSSTYYDKNYRQTAALIRARRQYLVRNIFTGIGLFGFAIGVCESSRILDLVTILLVSDRRSLSTTSLLKAHVFRLRRCLHNQSNIPRRLLGRRASAPRSSECAAGSHTQRSH